MMLPSGVTTKPRPTVTEARIGTDESGKGDYFGPLVVAAVCVRGRDDEKTLAAMGVRDSKTLADGKVAALAERIRHDFTAAVVAIGPARYNDLYARIGNLNRLLAWGHARALEDLLTACPTVEFAVTDKFGDESYVERALMERGRRITLIQKVRGEEDLAVAAASIVARAGFLERLARLAVRAGMPLPKGAGAPVEAAARSFARERGLEALHEVAKVHFKITARLGVG